ncbi:MAG: glycosyltransferase family 1 protein, partial [Bacteroidetes bacterium]
FIPLRHRSKVALFAREFPSIIKKYAIELAHFQYLTPFFKDCKFMVTTHDVLFNDFKDEFSAWYRLQRNFLFKKSLEKSDIRLTVSEYSRRRIAAHYGIPEQSIHITPNAVRKAFFQSYDAADARQYIRKNFGPENYLLYVSRIEPRKNHRMLMDAYRELRLDEQGIQLVFVGSDTLKSKKEVFEMTRMKADYPNHFYWFSQVNDADLLRFYQGARMFVYPSKAEGFGIPPIEAAAAGVNTLCSNATAMSDFDFFGNNFFSPDNLAELKEKILYNLQNPPQEWELYYLREKIQQRYSWDYSAEVVHRLIEPTLQISREHSMRNLLAPGIYAR